MITQNKIKFRIKSMSPMLMDKYTGINDSNDVEAKKNAYEKVYKNEEGKICIPSTGLKACIRTAGRDIGKKLECKKREQSIRAGLYFTQMDYSLDKTQPDHIHGEIVTRKGTGNKVTRVVSYRPLIKEWEIECEAVLYDLTPEFIKQAIELAGFKYGLFGHRPEYGRFKLIDFEILE